MFPAVNLCRRRMSRGSRAALWAASMWNGIPRWRAISPMVSMSVTAPISLLTCISDRRIVSSRSAGSTRSGIATRWRCSTGGEPPLGRRSRVGAAGNTRLSSILGKVGRASSCGLPLPCAGARPGTVGGTSPCGWIRTAPLRGQPALLREPVQGGEERARVDAERPCVICSTRRATPRPWYGRAAAGAGRAPSWRLTWPSSSPPCHRSRSRGRGVESAEVALKRGQPDAVIAGLLFMAGMRSEVSALLWGDVAAAAVGDGVLGHGWPREDRRPRREGLAGAVAGQFGHVLHDHLSHASPKHGVDRRLTGRRK